ncbi:hypothetical protein DI005_14820 [Prauserella sp. PE36]|uniref:Transcriptional regulator n=1 Tax=Prauserella endophytica TaxID=1592324 RepID=A0ABY2S748_9PSEU|nr:MULTISPECIES: hypothetical protein [Prauserella]PXY21734.1 hypothetical protein BAY59_30315 [Prauserella coralliicola]RBM20116.1 hypothetical protein DI005_14820 [Prauserella sp. PE36]TKG71523.1 hypothetical protein FCN18_12150 [Prauserella endophytica]
MAQEDTLDRLLRAWREDIDSEPFPVISDVVLPRQIRRRLRDDTDHTSRPPDRHKPGWTSTSS